MGKSIVYQTDDVAPRYKSTEYRKAIKARQLQQQAERVAKRQQQRIHHTTKGGFDENGCNYYAMAH